MSRRMERTALGNICSPAREPAHKPENKGKSAHHGDGMVMLRWSQREELPGTPRALPRTPRGSSHTRPTMENILRSRPRTHATNDLRHEYQRGQEEPPQDVNMSLGSGASASSKRFKDVQVLHVEDKSLEELEKQIQNVKLRFLEKNECRSASMQDIFRHTDIHKLGSLGREELAHAIEGIGQTPDPQLIDHLLATRATNRQSLSFHDFTRFFDDRGKGGMFKRPLKEQTGDCSKMTHLWAPTRPGVLGCREVGSLNDVLEADKREDGRFTHQLDGNFSGVQYNILNFDQNSVSVSPSVIVPIRKRDTLYEFPHPHGRKVNFDHGNTPWNIVTARTPRTNKRTAIFGQGINDHCCGADTWRSQTTTTNVPVRIHTFSRVHAGSLPSQKAMILGIMAPVVT